MVTLAAATKTLGLYLLRVGESNMRFRLPRTLLMISFIASTLASSASTLASSGAASAQQSNDKGNGPASSRAAKTRNPVPASAASIRSGHTLYDKLCASCHGETGKGDGSMGEELNPKPADLTDAEWKHGSTDGEIYALIRSGVKGTGMKAYGRKLTTHEVWDVVNYIRSIGPAKSH
jgi:mono/diheme cytochrome c family protein